MARTANDKLLMAVIGLNIRVERARHKWNQSNLAEESGVSKTSISYAENAVRMPTPSTLRTIAIALGTTPEWLKEDHSNEREKERE